MQDFDKILTLTADEKVELGRSFKELLNKELMLGMSRYQCRYGTLSDGHERITDAQRYYAAVKEMWVRACAVAEFKAEALEAQAELLDAQEHKDRCNQYTKQSDKYRADARLMKAQNRLRGILVNIEDTMRQLDEFNRVRLELQDTVRAKYPEGIEQAELDNWKAVAQYRAFLENSTGQPQMLRHVPLPTEEKAALGVAFGKPELAAWQAVADSKQLQHIERKLLGDKK